MSDIPITDEIVLIGDARGLKSDEEENSGGHTIVDSSGTEMPQRSNLKFNNATVTDDAQGDATIITPAGTDLSKVYQTTDSASSTINDSDYVPMSESGGAKKKTLWSTIITKIKSALGIASSGSTFLRKDGTWATPTDDTKVFKAGDTMSGQLKTSFRSSVAMGSCESGANTVPALCEELRYSSGCAGSVNITTAYTLDGVTVNAGWYNYLWIPHRSGGVNGAAYRDNCNYGTLFLSPMTTFSGESYIVRFSAGSISLLKSLVDSYNISSQSVSYATNSGSTNGHTVNKDVPSNAVFTDTTYPINYKAVDANIASKFRTETKGDTANGDYISTIRTNDASVTGFPQYGAGLAFGRSDTHGYILPAYASTGEFWVGGGNADKLNWQANLMTGVKSISRSGTTFTATRFDGTTFNFTQQDNDTKTGDQLTLGASKYGQNLGSMITGIRQGATLDTCIKDLLDNSVFINEKLSNFESFSGDYNTQTLAANTARAINASTSYKSISISDAGLYVLIAETTATSHVGQRTTSYFTGDDVSSVEMFPQTVPTGQNYFREQLIQFVAVTSSKTVTLMYWDSKSTGARHIWRIIRLLKY